MRESYEPYVPQTVGEIMDLLGSMALYSPTFKDPLGEFPQQNLDTEFFALNEGLKVIRRKLGEGRYNELAALSDRMRNLFQADPEDKTGESREGRRLIHEMEDLLTQRHNE